MARKPKKNSPDNFSVLFSKLMAGEDVEFQLGQFLSKHPSLVDLLIAIVRNRNKCTMELLEEHVPGEFRADGEAADILSQLSLVTFLEHSVKRWGINLLPWMDQPEKKPRKSKSTAKKKTASSGSAASAAIDKLGTKAQARKLLVKKGSLPALVKYLEGRGVTIREQNLRDTLKRHYGLKISEVLKGAPAKKKPGRKKKTPKADGQSKKGSTASQVVSELGGTTAKAKAALRKAGSVEALKNSLTIEVTEGNLRSILNRRFSISPRKVLQGAIKKSPGRKPMGSDDRPVVERVMAKLKNKAGAITMLKKAGSVSNLLTNLQGSIPDLTKANLVWIVCRKLGVKVGEVLGTSHKPGGTG